MVAPGDGAEIAPEWIVCMGGVHDVVDDVVVCPLGTLSSGTHCLACHFLEGSENDRLFERSCSVGPDTDPCGPQPGAPAASGAELIVELL